MRKDDFGQIIYYINNTKVANCLRKGLFDFQKPNDKKYDILVGHVNKNDKNSNIITKVKLLRENAETIEVHNAESIDYFDMMVADAIYSLWKSVEMAEITPLDIYRVMAGKSKITMTEDKRKEIENSVDKLATTRISIDCKAEMEQRGKNTYGYDQFFLSCYKVKFEGAKEEKRATDKEGRKSKQKVKYIITDAMPLYSYAEKLGQIIGVPIDLLNTSDEVKELLKNDAKETTNAEENTDAKKKQKRMFDTDDVIMLKHILIGRIEVMRNSNNTQDERNISFIRRDSDGPRLYTGILPLMGISRIYNLSGNEKENIVNGKGEGHKKEYITASAWTNKKIQIAKHVEDILEHFKEIGYIEDFEIKPKNAREKRSVEIIGNIGKPKELKSLEELKKLRELKS